jgi:hypothetical protein
MRKSILFNIFGIEFASKLENDGFCGCIRMALKEPALFLKNIFSNRDRTGELNDDND